MPAGGLELELSLRPVHRAEVERAIELTEDVLFEAGLTRQETDRRDITTPSRSDPSGQLSAGRSAVCSGEP